MALSCVGVLPLSYEAAFPVPKLLGLVCNHPTLASQETGIISACHDVQIHCIYGSLLHVPGQIQPVAVTLHGLMTKLCL